MRRVTARDVAAEVSVDPSTVSRVLYGKSRRHKYDPKTVTRIREVAKRLGYRASSTARALRSGRTMLVGMLAADIASPFFAELAGRIERHLRSSGYRLLIANTDEQAVRQGELIQEMMGYPVDGLIVAPSGDAGLSAARDADVAVVTVDRQADVPGIGHVGLDDRLAGRMVGESLRRRGYREVGVVLPDSPEDKGIGLRLEGLQKGLGDEGRLLWSVSGPRTSFAPDASDEVCDRLKEQMPQALVGLNLACNLTALAAISRMQLDMPARIGMIGIDDFPSAAFWRPGITVAAQPMERIAQQAVKILLTDIGSPDSSEARYELVPPELLERGSLR